MTRWKKCHGSLIRNSNVVGARLLSVCYHFFSSMEDSSFEDEYYDVMSSGRLPLNHSAASAPRKGMSPFLLEEMKKQLEVPLWIP